MSDRRPVFDALRVFMGGKLSQEEVDALDALLDLFRPRDGAGWLDLAIPLVKEFEGYHKDLGDGRVQAYPDPATGGAPWTIGHGSTTDEKGRPIHRGAIWTKERADARFADHLREFGKGVDEALAGSPATAHQKAALTSLAYNIGLGAFSGSTLLKRHKAGDYAGAADEFPKWRNAAGKVMPGLVRRRAAERELYLS